MLEKTSFKKNELRELSTSYIDSRIGVNNWHHWFAIATEISS